MRVTYEKEKDVACVSTAAELSQRGVEPDDPKLKVCVQCSFVALSFDEPRDPGKPSPLAAVACSLPPDQPIMRSFAVVTRGTRFRVCVLDTIHDRPTVENSAIVQYGMAQQSNVRGTKRRTTNTAASAKELARRSSREEEEKRRMMPVAATHQRKEEPQQQQQRAPSRGGRPACLPASRMEDESR